LGAYRADLLVDAGVAETARAEYCRDGPKRLPGSGLVQAIRLGFSPDDMLVRFYIGCRSRPVVAVANDYGKLMVTLRTGTP
jgi:hypothetical protein